jgi:hypothetical protein
VPIRTVATFVISALIAACSGPAATAQPEPTSGVPAASGAAPTGSTATAGAAIDLSKLDVCAIVPEATVEALTGESGFTTNQRADVRSASCFWGVPKPGVPQYLEVRVDRRTAPLGEYVLTVNNVPCEGADIPGVGTEARGGTCPDSQHKVWLIVLDRGVSVQVIVNEPKSALAPADLVAVVTTVLAGVG